MIVLTIDKATPSSLNASNGRHWSHKHRVRQEWGWLVKHAMLRAQIYIPPKWAKARITLERYGHNLLDADNCRAGFKPILDALVAEQIVTDDTLAVIGEPELRQFIDRKNPRTIIRVDAA